MIAPAPEGTPEYRAGWEDFRIGEPMRSTFPTDYDEQEYFNGWHAARRYQCNICGICHECGANIKRFGPCNCWEPPRDEE